jgi:hypothetical protein
MSDPVENENPVASLIARAMALKRNERSVSPDAAKMKSPPPG